MSGAFVMHTFMMYIKMNHLTFEMDMLRMFCIGLEKAFHYSYLLLLEECKFQTETDHNTFLSARLAVSESVKSEFIKRGSTRLEVREVGWWM